MAQLVSIQSGDFNTASTWGLVDSASNSYVDGFTTSGQALNASTSYTAGVGSIPTWTPGAITISAIALQIVNRPGSTGTFSMEIYNLTGAVQVAGSEVTVNVSDLPNNATQANGGNGWVVFKLASPVTLLAATNYQIRVKSSSSNQVTVLLGTASNALWSRQVITSTTQAPASGDVLTIAGDWTAAATGSSYTVDIANTATTAFGQVNIAHKGTLTFATSSSTNYYLKMTGIMKVTGGTLNVGTSGGRLPSTSTAVLEFNSSTAAQYGLEICGGSTVNLQGANKNAYSKMTADKAASATSIDVQDTTGWEASDILVFPTTTRTQSQSETKNISSVNSGTNLTLSAGLTNAHGGVAPVQATVGNLTRNVKLRGMNTTGTAYLRVFEGVGTTTVDIDDVEFTFIGSSFGGRQGIQNSLSTVGNFSMENSTFYNGSTAGATTGLYFESATGNGHTAKNNVFYITAGQSAIQNATTGVNIWDGNLFYSNTSGVSGLNASDLGSTYINNIVSGTSYGFQFSETSGVIANIEDNVAHGTSSNGFLIANPASGTVRGCKSWRTNSVGFTLAGSGASFGRVWNLTLEDCDAFGNNQPNLDLTGAFFGKIIVKNCSFQSDASFSTPNAVRFSTSFGCELIQFLDCSLGNVTAHSTSAITTGGGQLFFDCQIYRTAIQTTNPYTETSMSQIRTSGFLNRGIAFLPFNNVAGDYRYIDGSGITTVDTSIFNTAAPSTRLTPWDPNDQAFILKSTTKRIPVEAGQTISVSVWVRKSSAGDGAAYNGNQPRLMIRSNPLMGYDDDTALDTAAAATGTWEELSGTTITAPVDGVLEFYVDCRSTGGWPTTVNGWINVDDFTTTSTLADTDMKFTAYGQPDVNSNGGGGGGGGVAGGSWGFC